MITPVKIARCGLRAAGCCDGARVGVVMNNEVATLDVLFGAMKAGAVVTPLNTSIGDAAIAAMLADADAAAICVSADHAGRIDDLSLKRAQLRLCYGKTNLPGWEDFTKWRMRQSAEQVPAGPKRDDICNIIYSSGTTGQPKGIAHTHGARLDWAHDLAHALRYHCGARLLIATGLSSNITWAGMLPTLMLGGTIILRSGFDAGDALQTIARDRVTHTSMVPVQFQRLLEHPSFDQHDRSSMQAMMCCGAPLLLHTKERLFDTFACGVIELYGSTEGVVTTLAPEAARGRMASVGQPLPGEDLLILDDHNRILARGEAGEIVAKSRFAMAGYWNNAEATAEVTWTDAAGQRWLRSGDIGRLDDEGYLYITDRKKDMIISGGQNIYPADIEAVFVRHPDIVDCAVFGVPSERWGETLLALIVVRDGSAADAAALQDWANAQLGKQQRIGAVEFCASLPRNANGKLLKRELRQAYATPNLKAIAS